MPRRGHGEGTVFQRCNKCSVKMVKRKCPKCAGTSGTWVAQVSLGRKADGSRDRRTLYGRTEQEVLSQKTGLLARSHQGSVEEPTRLTVEQYMQQWLAHAKGMVELHTWVSYEQVVRTHIVPVLGHVQMTQLKPLQIQRDLYQSRLDAGRAPRTVRRIHEVLHNALNQAVEWQLLPANPATRAKPPRATKRELKFLAFNEARQWLEALQGNPLESLHLTAIMTGMREGELLGARWSDIDWEAGTLTVAQTVWIYKRKPIFKPYPKNRKVRMLPLAPVVLTKLKAHRIAQAQRQLQAGPEGYHNHGLIWCRPNGLPLRAEYALDHLRKTLVTAQLPSIRYHDLRHSAASLLLALGVPLKEVSETLGHSSVEITADVYGHLLPDAQRQSALKLEAELFGKKRKSSSS